MAKLSFITPIMVLNTQRPFKILISIYITTLVLHSYKLPLTTTKPITITDTENYLPSGDPNITNLMVSHYDCEKQHNLRQFNLSYLNNAQKLHQIFNKLVYNLEYWLEQRRNALKPINVSLMQKRNERFVSKALSNTDGSIELYGIIILCHFLLQLIL